MKIAVDGGGICTNSRFGTYTFSSSLLSALRQYDQKNEYRVYTFCENKKEKNLEFRNLQPTLGWMKFRVPLEELIHPNDIFLALNQAIPLYTSGKTIVFSHGFSFRLFPEFYGEDVNRLEKQVKKYLSASRFIIVSSQKMYQEFANFYPEFKNKISIALYGIPKEFENYEQRERKPYFLFTGMNNKIKNIEFLIKAFEKFRSQKKYNHFQLYLAGPHTEYERHDIKVFPNETRESLRELYRKATGYLTASYYESFNFPVLEALSQMCPVIGLQSAIIPEMQMYCAVVQKEDEFIQKMMMCADGVSHRINLKNLREEFSWKKLVNKLQELYIKA